MIKAQFVVNALDDGYLVKTSRGESTMGPQGPEPVVHDCACPTMSEVRDQMTAWHAEISALSLSPVGAMKPPETPQG